MDCSFLKYPPSLNEKTKKRRAAQEKPCFSGTLQRTHRNKKKKILSKQKDHPKGKPKRKRSLSEKRWFLEEKTHEKVLFLVMKQAVFSLKKRGASLIAPLY